MTLIGLVINAFILIFTGTSERYQILFIPTLIAFLLCIIGAILVAKNQLKAGKITFIIGSILFIPLGMVGILGIQKTISEIAEKKFNEENYGNSN